MNYSCINFKTNVGNLGNDKIVLVIPNGAGVCKGHKTKCIKQGRGRKSL